MSFRIKIFDNSKKNQWDDFVDCSNNGTIFHKIDFLNYHQDKFKGNELNLIIYKGDSIFGVIPFACFNRDGLSEGFSPYGASFGGIITRPKLNLHEAVEIVDCLVAFLKDQKIHKCTFQPTPFYYHKQPDFYIEFALLKAGFVLHHREVFNVIKLPENYDTLWNSFYEGRCRTTLKKRKDEFEVHHNCSLNDFYPILIEDKKRHDNAVPTHSISELGYLRDKFRDQVWFDMCVHKETAAKAGICYFQPSSKCILTFYMAQENAALKLDGKNVLIDYTLKKAIESGVEYFDFGGSTIGYEVQNPGVAKFKESFGARGYFREKFTLHIC